ncbi:PH domain-containing protein [Streptomyces sp. SID13666]|uniref:PH domain-containing protein n=1 Tax=unclassified Streptomyces TaxID=2593676 RepID=UPI0013C28225|nr:MULTISPECIES: PH domain-containing protein [unclassified Streptomyces]NEA58866.1 PH domain-containing protein [Streptomyces sp. SID13666]NEA72926.1 PH domain-containing protein [Streptomyces sp. SID13588]
MTSSDDPTPTPQPDRPKYDDRAYRSVAGIVTGALLIALSLWLGGDAVLRGSGRTPWLTLAGLLAALPLLAAFTIRPAVFAGEERLRIRNPFRTITVPWSAVEHLRAGYSTEVVAGGQRFQLWAIPVSLRARKRVARQTARAATATARQSSALNAPEIPPRAWSDQAVDELRELAETNAAKPGAQGEVSVRWAYEVIAPIITGAIVLAVLLAIG